MSERVAVMYSGRSAPHLVGALRWLCPKDGRLYDADGGAGALSSVSSGFMPLPGGRWSNGRSEVREVPWAVPTTPQKPTTRYPDGNPKSAQGAKKHSLRLFPLPAQVAACAALEDGCTKYGAANWRETGVAASVYMDAALRHMFQYFDGGEQVASDSGVHHLGHAIACLAIILDAEHQGTLIDDRPQPCLGASDLLMRT